ncbi:MAG: endonuclease/exonuclease/phosphatase family protein [Clostridia bacterium]|nr:endonuclease/exonuclease/phosphatase family protein [Clostridia bacterium]
MSTISVMTFNIRYDTAEDGPYQLRPYRYEYVDEYLKNFAADVIGFQEVDKETQKNLAGTLSNYWVIGAGRMKNFSDESSCIAFNRDKFQLLSCDTFWLSPTPGICDSYPLEVFPGRVCTTVTLIPKREKGRDATPFRVYNTHLFHNADERLCYYGVSVILDRMLKDKQYSDYPAVLMGDFNSEPDSLAIRSIKEFKPLKLADITDDVGYTYHEYENPDLKKTKIDYIFTDAEYDPDSIDKVTARRKGDRMFLSDHYPIRAEILL